MRRHVPEESELLIVNEPSQLGHSKYDVGMDSSHMKVDDGRVRDQQQKPELASLVTKVEPF